MPATYFITAKTERSAMMVFAADAADALKRAREMVSTRSAVSITDGGLTYSVEEFEAHTRENTIAKCGEPAEGSDCYNNHGEQGSSRGVVA